MCQRWLPQNRDQREEAAQCEPFLLRQIELVEPAVILSVGRISAQNLLNTETPVGQLRGRIFPFGERKIPLVVTYHPAYLLRSPEQKAKAWDRPVGAAHLAGAKPGVMAGKIGVGAVAPPPFQGHRANSGR